MSVDFTYTWGVFADAPGSPSGSFEIQIRRKGYQSENRSFDITKLTRKEGVRAVELGKVSLTQS